MNYEEIEQLINAEEELFERVEYYNAEKDLIEKGAKEIINPDITNSGNIDEIMEYLRANSSQLSDYACRALIFRVRSLKKFEEIERENHNKKYPAAKVLVNERGDVLLEGVQLDQKQGTGNGCWSCSYSLMLQSRGVNIPQEIIRAYHNDTRKNEKASEAEAVNFDVPLNPAEKTDILMKLVPNTAMKETYIKITDKDVAFFEADLVDPVERLKFGCNKMTHDVKKEVAQAMKTHIRKCIAEEHSPVGLLISGHFVTVVGMTIDDNILIYNSSEENPTLQTKTVESFLDFEYLGDNGNISMVSLVDIDVNSNNLKQTKLDGEMKYFSVDENGNVLHSSSKEVLFQEDLHNNKSLHYSKSSVLPQNKIACVSNVYFPSILQKNVTEAVVEEEIPEIIEGENSEVTEEEIPEIIERENPVVVKEEKPVEIQENNQETLPNAIAPNVLEMNRDRFIQFDYQFTLNEIAADYEELYLDMKIALERVAEYQHNTLSEQEIQMLEGMEAENAEVAQEQNRRRYLMQLNTLKNATKAYINSNADKDQIHVENAKELLKFATEQEDAFKDAFLQKEEEKLAKIQEQVAIEREEYTIISEILAYELSNKLRGYSMEDALEQIQNGPVLRKMLEKDGAYESLLNMALDNTEEFVNSYMRLVTTQKKDELCEDSDEYYDFLEIQDKKIKIATSRLITQFKSGEVSPDSLALLFAERVVKMSLNRMKKQPFNLENEKKLDRLVNKTDYEEEIEKLKEIDSFKKVLNELLNQPQEAWNEELLNELFVRFTKTQANKVDMSEVKNVEDMKQVIKNQDIIITNTL